MNGFEVNRTVVIHARPSVVFRYFTDSARFAAWWGEGSRIDPRPGGEVHIRYPNGATAGGNVVELVADERIVFTYGYDDATKPIARGASRVVITVAPHAEGTLLKLVHEVTDATTRDAHVPGWRFQLSLFANVVTREVNAALAERVDRYFSAWTADTAENLAEATTESVTLKDGFACIAGRDELALHIAASRVHMPGVVLKRDGAVRQCQGTALVDWVALGQDGTPMGRGTNVLTLSPDGHIGAVVGFWAAPPA